jgi:hypothetical protein
MLNGLEFFDELYGCGVRLDAADGKLHSTAPFGVLTDELKQEIVANRDQLLGIIEGATGVLNRYGVRIIGTAIGLWRVTDVPEVRRALKAIGRGEAEVRYLDDPDADVPSRYREFVPPLVQHAWDEQGVLGTPQQRIAAEWKARVINATFDRLGTLPTPSRITAETVLHGELGLGKRKP